MDLMAFHKAAHALSDLEGDPSPERFEAAMAAVDNASATYREMREEWKRLSVEYLETEGDVTIGESRYYAGNVKSYKPRLEQAAMLETLLTAFDGDMHQVADCLSSGAWKPGTVRSLLDNDERFGTLFETITQVEAKTGKPKREMKRAR